MDTCSEGAVIWYVKQSVTTRVAKYTIGVELWPSYNQDDHEHYQRRDKAFLTPVQVPLYPLVPSHLPTSGDTVW